MDKYVTGSVIRRLREEKKMTQADLAEKLFVSDKTISKWECSQGFPDISLLEPLAKALNISVIELLNGESVINQNRSFNMKKTLFYVCPVCGNIIQAAGEALVSCCGITLPPLLAETQDEEHVLHKEKTEDEYYVTMDHPMTKEHYISFLAALSDQHVELVKLYPEMMPEARFKIRGVRKILAYCNRHGLYEYRI